MYICLQERPDCTEAGAAAAPGLTCRNTTCIGFNPGVTCYVCLQERAHCAEAGPAAVPDLNRQHGQALLEPARTTRRTREGHT
jgi:hypothetical protein